MLPSLTLAPRLPALPTLLTAGRRTADPTESGGRVAGRRQAGGVAGGDAGGGAAVHRAPLAADLQEAIRVNNPSKPAAGSREQGAGRNKQSVRPLQQQPLQ